MNTPLPVVKAPATVTPLHDSQWGALAMEYLLRTAPLPDLLVSYKLTPEGWESLKANPEFAKVLDETRKGLDAVGPDAGFIVRSKHLAEESLPILRTLMHDRSVAPETRARIAENFVKWARMLPEKQEQKGVAIPTMVFNFGMGRSVTIEPND